MEAARGAGWYSTVEEGAARYMADWFAARSRETRERHTRELFAVLPFPLSRPEYASPCETRTYSLSLFYLRFLCVCLFS